MAMLHELRNLLSLRRPGRGPVAIELDSERHVPSSNGTHSHHDADALRALSTAARSGGESTDRGGVAIAPSELDAERLRSLVNLLDGYLTADARRSKRTIVLLEKLPGLLAPLSAVQQQQLRLGASLEEGLQQFRQRDRAMHEMMQRLHESSRQQTEVLGLTQQQFDAHRAHVKHLADALNAFHRSIDAIAASNQSSARVIEETMKSGVKQQRDVLLAVMHIRRWLVACACISASAAVLTAVALIAFMLRS